MTNATTHPFMNRIEQQLSEVEWRLVAQPRVELHQDVRRITNKLASFMQTRFDTAMQQLPKRGHADHARDVTVLNGFRQVLAVQFVKISNLRAATYRREKSSREFKSVMQWQD